MQITAVTGREVKPGALPSGVGCNVCSTRTAYAVYQACYEGKPCIERIVTVSGSAMGHTSNALTRVGTPFGYLAEQCGGFVRTPKKIVLGGPMMGIALANLDVPIQKQNNGLTLLGNDPVEAADKLQTACLHCGRCTTVCPVGLMPQLMSDAAELKDYQRYEVKLHGLECVQCGSCTYACPAKRPLMQVFKQAKAEITAMKKREGGSQK